MKIHKILIPIILLHIVGMACFYHGRQNKTKIKEVIHSVFQKTITQKNKLFGISRPIRTLQEATPEPLPNKEELREECAESETKIPFMTTTWLIFVFTSLGLICYAGIMSGMTVGYMGINISDLMIKANNQNSSKEDKKAAKTILPILEKHHLLLVTLLLNNAIAMEALPIFLDALVPSWLAILLSTTAVLLFGEVIPQALCTGKNQIKIATALSPFISFMMTICYPIAYPIAKLLDYLLGKNHEHKKYVVPELIVLLQMQLHKIKDEDMKTFGYDGAEKKKKNSPYLINDELQIMVSTLQLRDQIVEQFMIPINKVLMVSSLRRINLEFIEKVHKSGYSRVVVYKKQSKNKILGILVTKNLLNYSHLLGMTIREASEDLKLELAVTVAIDTNLLEMLSLFQEKQIRLALVVNYKAKAMLPKGEKWDRHKSVMEISTVKSDIMGIITLRDLFGEIVDWNFEDGDSHGHSKFMSSEGANFRNSLSKKNKYKEAQEEGEYEMMEKPLMHDH